MHYRFTHGNKAGLNFLVNYHFNHDKNTCMFTQRSGPEIKYGLANRHAVPPTPAEKMLRHSGDVEVVMLAAV